MKSINAQSGRSGARLGRAALMLLVLFSAINVSSANAQSYLNNLGAPSFTTKLPVESGFINIANGNLHLEIPLGSYPQRGRAEDNIVLMYDSSIWVPNSGVWSPNVPSTSYPLSAGGWRLVTSGDAGGATSGEYDYGWCTVEDDYTYARYSPWIWIAPDGTQHSFPAVTIMPLYPGTCGGTGTPTATAYASDGSGFSISITDYSNAIVYAPDGTVMNDAVLFGTKTDPNGNQYLASFSYPPYDYKILDTLSSTLGRSIVEVTESSDGSAFYYDVPKVGGTSRYTVHLATVYYSTSFGESGISEASSSFQAPVEIDLPDGTSYTLTYDSGTSAGHYGLLSSLTLPTGGTINYTFNNYTDALGNVGRWITNRQTPDTGSGSWSYSGPSVVTSCSSGQVNCQQQITVTKPSGDTSTYSFILNGGAWPTQIQYYSGSTLLSSTSACYTFASLSGTTCTYPTIASTSPATNVYRNQMQTTLPVPGGNVSATTQYTWDSSNNGNLTKISEWNFNSSGANRITDVTYYSNGQVINRPASVSVNSGAVAKTVYSYDESGLVSSACTSSGCGNLTTVSRYIDGSNHLDTHYHYDGYGNRTSIIDPALNTTSYSYDATDAYLNQITFPPTSGVSHIEYPTFDSNTGLLTSYQGQNSDTTSYSYDSMGRLIQTTFPDAGWTKTQYSSATVVDTGIGITSTTPSVSCSTTGNACRHDEMLLDSLGRASSQILVSDPNGSDTVAIAYDSNGLTHAVTNPYRSSSSVSETLTYDALDRVQQIQKQDGSSSYFYYGAGVSSAGGATSQGCAVYGIGYPILKIDEAGKKREWWIDAFGRTIEVDEPDSSGGMSQNTCYVYDLNNNLTYVVAYGGTQQRSFTYDLVSRLASATTPESGTTATAYYYTASGGGLCSGDANAVCRRTDGRSTTTTYSYDALNRLISKTYTDGTPGAYYNYDQSAPWGFALTNYIGRLTTMYTISGGTNITANCLSYDERGRVILDLQQVASNYNETTYTYNYASDVSSTGYPYPSSLTVTPGYDSANNVKTIISSWSDSQHPGTLATVNSYTPDGTITNMYLGNGLTESAFPNSRLQPCRINVNSSATSLTACTGSAPSGNVQDFQLGYGTSNNGNVLSWSGTGAQAFSRSFSYDSWNRLSGMTASSDPTSCNGLSWSYDAWGNRTQTVTSGTCGSWNPSYNYTLDNNRISTVGTTTYTYDGAGNLTYDGSHNYAYDAENRLISVDSTTATYDYDARGNRAQKTYGGAATQYVYDESGHVLMEMQGSTISNTYVYLGGQLLAEYTGELVARPDSLTLIILDQRDFLPT